MQLTEEQEFTMRAAQKGYESYCKYSGNKSIMSGNNLPNWKNLTGEVKNAWFAAANKMISFLAKQRLVHDLKY